MFPKLLLVSTLTLVATALADDSQIVHSSLLRGSKDRELPHGQHPHPSGSHHSAYQGCLSYSTYELSRIWTFPGQAPDCSWTHTGNGGTGGSSGGAGSGSSGESGEGSSSGGGGNGSGGNGDSGGSGSSGGGGGGGNGQNGVDDDGNIDSNGRDEVVVSNEDVSQGDTDYDPITDFDIEVVSSK